MTCLTVCVVPLGSVTDSPMCGTAKKLQVCSVSIDWWPRYTVHEIVIEGAYRAELPEIALCPMPGYSTTARKFKLNTATVTTMSINRMGRLQPDAARRSPAIELSF